MQTQGGPNQNLRKRSSKEMTRTENEKINKRKREIKKHLKRYEDEMRNYLTVMERSVKSHFFGLKDLEHCLERLQNLEDSKKQGLLTSNSSSSQDQVEAIAEKKEEDSKKKKEVMLMEGQVELKGVGEKPDEKKVELDDNSGKQNTEVTEKENKDESITINKAKEQKLSAKQEDTQATKTKAKNDLKYEYEDEDEKDDKKKIFAKMMQINKNREKNLNNAQIAINKILNISDKKRSFEMSHSLKTYPYLGKQLNYFKETTKKKQREQENEKIKWMKKMVNQIDRGYLHMLKGNEESSQPKILPMLKDELSELDKEDREFQKLSLFLSNSKYKVTLPNFEKSLQSLKRTKIKKWIIKKGPQSVFASNKSEKPKTQIPYLHQKMERISTEEYQFIMNEKIKGLVNKQGRLPRVNLANFNYFLMNQLSTIPSYILVGRERDIKGKGGDTRRRFSIINIQNMVVLNLSFMNEKPKAKEEARSSKVILVGLQFNFLWDKTKNYNYDDLMQGKFLILNSIEKRNKLQELYRTGGQFSLFCESTSSRVMESMTEACNYSLRNQLKYQDYKTNYHELLKIIFDYFRILSSKKDGFQKQNLVEKRRDFFACDKCSTYRKSFYCEQNKKVIVQFPFWTYEKKASKYYHLVCIQRIRKKKLQKEIDNFVMVKKAVMDQKYMLG